MKDGLFIDENGIKIWYKNGVWHKEDGPAIEYPDGSKYWYINGKRHREDGPAVERYDGTKYWFYYNKKIDCSSTEEFIRIIRLRNFW